MIAGQSAFGGEADFGCREIKSSLANADGSFPLRLFSWPASPDEIAALRPLQSRLLGVPMVLAAAGEAGGLVAGRRLLRARTADGTVVWRRSLDSLHGALGAKLQNALLVRCERPPRSRMVITGVEVLWVLDVRQLDALIAGAGSGLLIGRRELALGLRRSQLRLLYRQCDQYRADAWRRHAAAECDCPQEQRNPQRAPRSASAAQRPRHTHSGALRPLCGIAAAVRTVHRVPQRLLRRLIRRGRVLRAPSRVRR